jgi:isoleucyl-tRNA synthetase
MGVSSTGRGSTRRSRSPVDPDGRFTSDAPGFEGRRVITEKGEKGDANQAVIEALVAAGMLIARGRSSINILIPGAPRSR